MTTIRIIRERIMFVLSSAIIYFCFDFFIIKTSFLKSYSFVGFKSFLPMILGLNYGPYGVIGELIAIIIKYRLTNQTFLFFAIECMIVIIMGLGSWVLWHAQSYTHRVRFRYVENCIRYVAIALFLSLVCATIGLKYINVYAFEDILVWNFFMSILVGIPIEIIYGSLMNLDPILPPITVKGKKIKLVDDIRYALDGTTESLLMFNEKIEKLLEREQVDIKRTYEIQNVSEEVYLRIIKKYPNIVIDVKANYDITFSIEFIYIQKKYNPFIVAKGEDQTDVAGLSIIKHRALLASYKYNYGLNKVHIVI